MLLLFLMLLVSGLQIQLVITTVTRDAQKDCEDMTYVSSYDEKISQGVKVLDALKAQQSLINNNVSELTQLIVY